MLRHSDIERWIQRDPAGRGLLAYSNADATPCAGHLAAAALELATQAKCVGVVTGFFIPDAPQPAAETDGPIGAILLADVLHRSGVEAFLLTDQPCESVLRTAMSACGVDAQLLVCPVEAEASQRWQVEFRESRLCRSLTHLLSVERIGPSLADARCRNMRGTPIDEASADLYRLFEDLPPHVRTIGIGDGGNEIGMGNFWKDADHIPPNACRTHTDWTIIAGVSDWGGMALVATYAQHRGNIPLIHPWTSARILHTLEHMVLAGPAIDGCTLLREPTVDGLPSATYLQPWEQIRRMIGIGETICF